MNSLFRFRFELSRRTYLHDVLMIFSAVPSLDPDAFATVVEAEIETNLVPDELLIVVREPSFEDTAKQLADGTQNAATLARLANRSTVTLLGYDRFGREINRRHIAGPPPARQVKFTDFQRRAVTSIFNTRCGFVDSTATYHFENPSGRHTERFIRLSNILARGAEISFLGFCTMPYVPPQATIAYLDTPSLYAVVAAINEQLASFKSAPSILADNFQSYAGAEAYRFSQRENAFVLISGSSSGGLAYKLITEHGFVSEQMTHILFLGNDRSSSNIVCDLSKDNLQNPEGIAAAPRVEDPSNCSMCASGSHAIKLQGDQFEFAGPQQEPLLVARTHAPAGLADLLGRLAGGAVFEVGLGRASGKQLRQFNINQSALQQRPSFQSRLAYALRRSLPAALSHVVTVDDASIPFAQQIASFVGEKAKVIDSDGLNKIDSNTESSIVIAAAVNREW